MGGLRYALGTEEAHLSLQVRTCVVGSLLLPACGEFVVDSTTTSTRLLWPPAIHKNFSAPFGNGQEAPRNRKALLPALCSSSSDAARGLVFVLLSPSAGQQCSFSSTPSSQLIPLRRARYQLRYRPVLTDTDRKGSLMPYYPVAYSRPHHLRVRGPFPGTKWTPSPLRHQGPRAL